MKSGIGGNQKGRLPWAVGTDEIPDSRNAFTIQSISKPFVYGLALEDNTRAEVQAKVGVEPTGDAFNAISLEPGTGRPRNPMINAGAIAAAGMIAGKSHSTRLSLNRLTIINRSGLIMEKPASSSDPTGSN